MEETWVRPELMLEAAVELDTVGHLPQTDRKALRAFADFLHKEYSRMWTQDGIPSKLELDILPAWWAKKRNTRKDPRIKDINDIMREETLNILWIATYGPFGMFEGEIERAKEFCLMLHRAALAAVLDERCRFVA